MLSCVTVAVLGVFTALAIIIIRIITSRKSFTIVVKMVDCMKLHLNPAVCRGDYAMPTCCCRVA